MDDFDATDPTPNYDVSTSLGLSVILKRPRLIASSKLDVNFAWYKDDAQVEFTKFINFDLFSFKF